MSSGKVLTLVKSRPTDTVDEFCYIDGNWPRNKGNLPNKGENWRVEPRVSKETRSVLQRGTLDENRLDVGLRQLLA